MSDDGTAPDAPDPTAQGNFRPARRLEAFSDAVIAIAATLLVLDVRALLADAAV